MTTTGKARGLKIAVIGAGAAGIIAARELARNQSHHQVTVFEKNNRLGGIWAYNPRVESDPIGLDPSRSTVHSSMYLSLRTNLPRHLMGFFDYPFSGTDFGDPRMFPRHEEVLAFLERFAAEFGIWKLIKFGCEVVRVERVPGGNDGTSGGDGGSLPLPWIVRWRKKKRGNGSGEDYTEEEDEVFDAVVICNGHATAPRPAEIPGIQKWAGEQIHSHNYRIPEPFKGKVVVIVGNGASAHDISKDIATVAKEVHLSSRSSNAQFSKSKAYHNLFRHSQIDYVNEDGQVAFKDGTLVNAHVILHCTGYKYEFPFLNTDGIVSVHDNRVGPLYKHVFPPELAPWLSFVGLPQKVAIFPMLELQSKWVARVLSGQVKLPSKDEMLADVERYYHDMSVLNRPKHLTHYLYTPIEDEYLDWIAKQAGEELVDWKKQLYRETVRRILDLDKNFRDDWDVESWLLNASTILARL